MKYIQITRPIDDQLAYEALQSELKSIKYLEGWRIYMNPTQIMERNGEAILAGGGIAMRDSAAKTDYRVLETMKFDFVGVFTRNCYERYSRCYNADEMGMTAEKSMQPQI